MEETKTISKSVKKDRIGIVVSDKMHKTIVVEVHRRMQHPKFKKIVSKFKKFYVHDEKQEAKDGDLVRIEETRPLSKLKRWRLVEIIESAEQTGSAKK
jgi:small subunit ribosomal protein S17